MTKASEGTPAQKLGGTQDANYFKKIVQVTPQLSSWRPISKDSSWCASCAMRGGTHTSDEDARGDLETQGAIDREKSAAKRRQPTIIVNAGSERLKPERGAHQRSIRSQLTWRPTTDA